MRYGFGRKIKTATLEELEDKCYELVGTTMEHNMIGIILGEVEKRFGEDKADKIHRYIYNVPSNKSSRERKAPRIAPAKKKPITSKTRV